MAMMTDKSRLIKAGAKDRVRGGNQKGGEVLRDILSSHNVLDLLSPLFVESNSGVSLEEVVRFDIECRARHTGSCLV
jgi:hypothetical protein